VTTNESSGLAINLQTATNGSGNVLYGLKYPSPSSTPYRVRAFFQWDWFGVNGGGNGAIFFGWMDTAGKLIGVYFRNDPEFFLAKFASVSSYNSSYATVNNQSWGPDFWFGLRNDGTHVYLEASKDGVNFTTLASDTVSGGYLADYGHTFWGFSTATSSGVVALSVTLRCYDPNGLSAAFPNSA
jgi:hypothetical protein